jgi:hypothetical protein
MGMKFALNLLFFAFVSPMVAQNGQVIDQETRLIIVSEVRRSDIHRARKDRDLWSNEERGVLVQVLHKSNPVPDAYEITLRYREKQKTYLRTQIAQVLPGGAAVVFWVGRVEVLNIAVKDVEYESIEESNVMSNR